MSEFCVMCEKKLNFGFGKFGLGKEKMYEFREGFYCEECAKIKVKKDRG